MAFHCLILQMFMVTDIMKIIEKRPKGVDKQDSGYRHSRNAIEPKESQRFDYIDPKLKSL